MGESDLEHRAGILVHQIGYHRLGSADAVHVVVEAARGTDLGDVTGEPRPEHRLAVGVAHMLQAFPRRDLLGIEERASDVEIVAATFARIGFLALAAGLAIGFSPVRRLARLCARIRLHHLGERLLHRIQQRLRAFRNLVARSGDVLGESLDAATSCGAMLNFATSDCRIVS